MSNNSAISPAKKALSMKKLLTATALVAGALTMTMSTAAYAKSSTDCSKKNTRTKGTVIGAIAGGVIGNKLASHGNKTAGTAVGAAVGGVAGSQIGAKVKEKCK